MKSQQNRIELVTRPEGQYGAKLAKITSVGKFRVVVFPVVLVFASQPEELRALGTLSLGHLATFVPVILKLVFFQSDLGVGLVRAVLACQSKLRCMTCLEVVLPVEFWAQFANGILQLVPSSLR